MQNGQCPRCKSTQVYKKMNGIVSGDKCVYVKGLSMLTSPSDRLTFLCSQCGYYEDHIVDPEVLQKIKEKWEKA